MAMFKRATWHSGLTYKQTCDSCSSTVEYTDHSLDFRPWFADGFVYCPKCKKPLRHRESYAINEEARPAPEHFVLHQNVPVNETSGFCTQCGKPLRPGDIFCPGCGTKRA